MDQLQQTLKDRFGWSDFRPGQRAAIESILGQGSALAVFPTGAGKSLCYQLPALLIDGLTVVVSPLLALMKDQIDFLTRHGVSAARLDSTLSADEVREVGERIRTGQLKLLYVAPERFNNERFLAELQRTEIGLFAVDEAHCISEWGHNFRPDYLKLAETARALGAKRILALTATATPSVVEDICRAFRIPANGAITTGFFRPNLQIEVTPSGSHERIDILVRRLKERPAGTTIVYVTLQRTAEQLAARLQAVGIGARAYHAGMESDERTSTQEWWMSQPGAVVVATIAFGMGIDKANVRYVYHYNLPKSLEAYSQEIGRAGRDGESSIVEVLACLSDLPMLANFAYGDTPEPTSIRSLVSELLGGPEVVDVAPRELGDRHDLRPLVLKTALTYLELEGALRKGTPFYAGYEFRPTGGIDAVLDVFGGEPGQFVRDIVQNAKKGRIWYGVDPAGMAATLACERRRVIRALEVLSEKGLIELRTSDLRDRYERLEGASSAHQRSKSLIERFEARERGEQVRLARVPALLQSAGCLANELAAYFGEVRETPCGICTVCRTGAAVTLPKVAPETPLRDAFSMAELNSLADAFPQALGTARQRARFLCGLTSPSLTKSRLSRNRLFGATEEFPFEEVLDAVD